MFCWSDISAWPPFCLGLFQYSVFRLHYLIFVIYKCKMFMTFRKIMAKKSFYWTDLSTKLDSNQSWHSPIQWFQTALPYLATAIIYKCKMFMKLRKIEKNSVLLKCSFHSIWLRSNLAFFCAVSSNCTTLFCCRDNLQV